MAYRVPNDATQPAWPHRPSAARSGALTRNALIAGVSFAALAVVSAGALLTGNNEFASVSSADRRAIKIALVDPVAPSVVARDPRVALDTPAASSITIASATTTIVARTEPEPAPVIVTPLPVARPTRAIEAQIALENTVPLPRDRQAALQALASLEPKVDTKSDTPADAETTGSLGSLGGGSLEPAHALGYAASPEPLESRPVIAITKPVAAAPTAAASRANDFIGPQLPKVAKATPPKPSRPLTPHEKLWGSVRVASLGTTDELSTGFDPNSGLPRAPYDKQTAVYVISDRKVYMPDGSALEAHSGLGDKMDDPRFVHVRMRGATPPHVYDLTMRESLFHGVEAIRMTPMKGESAIFGRDGILAHTYMLGPNGQSNGCVSFKDYDAFLDAFKAGKVSRMAVIGKLD